MSSIKNSKWFELEYTRKDEKYIDELLEYIEEKSKEVSCFFDIDRFDEKVYIKLFDNLDSFREACSKVRRNREIPMWLCGLSFQEQGKDYIYIYIP